MTIEKVNDHFVFIKAAAKLGLALDGTYLKSSDMWRLPLNLGALRDLYKAGYDVEALGKRLAALYKATIGLKDKTNPVDRETGLREYQQQDVNFLTSVDYAGVFNEQRTGEHL